MLRFALLTVYAAGTLGACTTHPENGGYYLEGIAGTDKTAHSSGGVGVGGGPKIASAWVPDKYYPHGEMKLCTGMYCSETSRTVGSAQHVPAHTCAKVRFTYNSSYDVWQMKNQTYLDRCDFTDAVKVGDTDKGTPFDFHIEDTVKTGTIFSFASQAGCAAGMKVSVEVVGGYDLYHGMCSGMGAGSSRILDCDCQNKMKPSTTVDPCYTGFVAGCMADMPDDLSCCPPKETTYDTVTGKYVGTRGTCLAKSKDTTYKATTEALKESFACNTTHISELEAMSSCKIGTGYHAKTDAMCAMYKDVKMCDVVEPPASCATNQKWSVYISHGATLTAPTCAAGDAAAPPPPPTSTVSVSFTLSGTVTSFDAHKKLSIASVIAKGAGVKPSAVAITVAAGSVVVTADIEATDAAATQTSLTSGILTSKSSLQTALAAGGVTATVESDPIVTSGGLSTGALVGIIVGSAVGAILLLVVIYCMFCKSSTVTHVNKGGSNA